MSDDVPLILAADLARGDASQRAAFLSAMSLAQMQQYAAAGWEVLTAPAFASPAPIDLAAVPAQSISDIPGGASVLSLEGPTWPEDAAARIARWAPQAVKVNLAFHGVAPDRAERIAGSLVGLGFDLLASHWQTDPTYGWRSLTRIDRFAAFGAPDWAHMNLIGVRDRVAADRVLTIARLHVGHERRIAELRVGHAVRGDHIARLEKAMMALQGVR
jgi:hypothetical protein